MKHEPNHPRFLCNEKGEPTDVVLNLNHYQEILERLEDVEDLELLKERRRTPSTSRPFEEYVTERAGRV